MPNYRIEGSNGSGKTTVGNELSRRGYAVIEADLRPGLSSWVNVQSGQKVRHSPPFSAEWLKVHEWRWDPELMNQILSAETNYPQFIVGGAHNMDDFLPYFKGLFALHVDNATLTKRLMKREPHRWLQNSPELQAALERNPEALEHYERLGAVVLNGALPVSEIADQILDHIL